MKNQQDAQKSCLSAARGEVTTSWTSLRSQVFLDTNFVRFFYGTPDPEDGEHSSLEIIMQGTGEYVFQFF